MSQNNFNEAVQVLQQSIRFREKFSPHSQAACHLALGDIYYSQQLWDQAFQDYEMSYGKYTTTGDERGKAESAARLGFIFCEKG